MNDETPLMRAIRAELLATGKPLLWRCNNGVDLARGVRYGLGKGNADLIGLLKPTGRFIAFEAKTKTGRLSHDQRLWLDIVNASGGYACVVRSVDEALYHLELAEKPR